MSEIRATTISDETGNGPIALTKQTAAKGYVHFTSFTNPPSILNSFNSSSLVDDATEVGVNLTNSMSNALFIITGICGHEGANPSSRSLAAAVVSSSNINSEVYATSHVQVEALCHLAWFGDLA